MDNKLVEFVAKALYQSMERDVRGSTAPLRMWITSAPWDSQPGIELCEWERDEFRTLARTAIGAIDEGRMRVL